MSDDPIIIFRARLQDRIAHLEEIANYPKSAMINDHLLGLCRDLDKVMDEIQTELIAIKFRAGQPI